MKFVRRQLALGLAALLAAMTASCTTRKEMSDVRSRFGFDEGYWGGQRGGGKKSDKEEIKAKYANAGWHVDKDGNILGAKNKNLFSGDSKEGKKKYRKKEARLKSREVGKEIYRTPEYLERQQYNASKTAKEAKLVNRDSNFDQNRAGEAGRTARESGDESPGILKGLNPFRSRSAREGGDVFKTSRNAEVARAESAVPVAGGLPRDGDTRRAAMSRDDVKRMLHPETFD